MSLDEDALEYHRRTPPGKLAIKTTKPTSTQRDLSLAYSPGVAAPCREIAADETAAYRYTTKGNLVGVVSDGSAVLGLGDIGPQASKPVMEGKGVLFKRFADIDVFDIELDHDNPEAMIESIAAMEPTFGGINLEDISAPECFTIEQQLRERMDIPVFHDDQHGTAIISGAALINAAELASKELDELEIVFSGAGASAIATARFYVSLGADPDKITMCDSGGIITEQRVDQGDAEPYKREFARPAGEGSLANAMEDADVFVGLSVGGIVDKEMIRSMASNPIVFAMANPDPEIGYEEAKAAREDTIIMATGRSDYPNQVNNVLGFPFMFRGALDVGATEINEEMEVAAARALAKLARKDVPDEVRKAYDDQELQFGPDYIIPKPLDPRVLFTVAPAVAQAAIESGCARLDSIDTDEYVRELEARLGKARELVRVIYNKAKTDPKRVVLPEGTNSKVIRAAAQLETDQIAEPVLIGDRSEIYREIDELGLEFNPEIVDPDEDNLNSYAERIYTLRNRKGITKVEAEQLAEVPNYLGSAMVELGDVDAMVTGLQHTYPDALRPSLEIIGPADDQTRVAGVYMLTFENRVVFCADVTTNPKPDADVLKGVTEQTAELARRFNIEPRAALLSYSNFGTTDNKDTQRLRTAADNLRDDPAVDFPVDGEMQADTAVTEELLRGEYGFSDLDAPANVLVFPNLEAGNISYKLLQRLGGATAVGPMLVGMDKPVHVLQRGDDVDDIVTLAAVAVVNAQEQDD